MTVSEADTTVRSFMAIPLGTTLREQVLRIQEGLRNELPGVRWSRPETLHLTLRFFGEIAAESLERAAKLVLSVNPLGSPFELPLSGLGAFPTAARPRVLWLGFAASPPLQNLFAQLEELLSRAGIPREPRPFVPHLTLGRAKGRLPDITRLLQQHSETVRGVLPIERIVIYRSRLLPGGAEHTPLYTFELGNRSGRPLQPSSIRREPR